MVKRATKMADADLSDAAGEIGVDALEEVRNVISALEAHLADSIASANARLDGLDRAIAEHEAALKRLRHML